MGNILQNSLDVTCEDFLKGVFGVRPKPERDARKALFSGLVTGKSTPVYVKLGRGRKSHDELVSEAAIYAERAAQAWRDPVRGARGGAVAHERRRRPKRVKKGVFGRLGLLREKVRSAFWKG